MKATLKHITLFVLLLMASSCSKENEQLVLNSDYLYVADVLEYCQGSCNVQLDWEGSEVLVQGHVMDVENDSIMQDYMSNSRFYFSDIRNGMFMEIRVTGDEAAIFAFLENIGKQDRLFIRGTAESVIVNEGTECMKGVIIELFQAANIQLNQ